MECLLRLGNSYRSLKAKVLILILMECLLSSAMMSRALRKPCLNPYSNGMLT